MSATSSPCSSASKFVTRFLDFWTAPASPRPLAWFRIGLAGVLLVQALEVVGNLNALYGRDGIINWSMADAPPPGVPNLDWLEHGLTSIGLPSGAVVPMAYAGYLMGLVGLLLGCRTRAAAIVAWLTHTALTTSGEMAMYGADNFAQIGLFYCVGFPVGRAVSLDALKAPDSFCSGPTSHEERLGLRTLQVHLCVAYFASGLEKMLGQQWWGGEAVWRAATGADDALVDCSFLAAVPWLAQATCWLTLLLEAGCPLFVWHPQARRLWLVGIVGMHVGIALTLNLWMFAATMIVFDVAAFGVKAQLEVERASSSSTNFERSSSRHRKQLTSSTEFNTGVLA